MADVSDWYVQQPDPIRRKFQPVLLDFQQGFIPLSPGLVLYDWDSFDYYTAAAIRYDSVLFGGSGVIAPTCSSSAARTGTGQGIRFIENGTSGSPISGFQAVRKSLGTRYSTICASFAFRLVSLTGVNSAVQIFTYLDNTTSQVELRINPSRQLEVRRQGSVLGTSTVVLNTNIFYHLAFKVVVSTIGSFEVRVDNVTAIPLTTGADTTATANNYTDGYQLGTPASLGINNISATLDIDDLVISNDFVGNKIVRARLPIAAGSSTMFVRGGTNTGANFSQVNPSLVDGNPSNVNSQISGDVDSYTVSSIPSTTTGIVAVCPFAVATRTDVSSRQIAVGINSGGIVQDSAAKALNLPQDTSFHDAQLTDPQSGTTWVATNVNAAEVRVKEVI